MSTYGLWMSAAGMKVNDHRQTLLAQNMANAHTTGFKRDLAVVRERTNELMESRSSRMSGHDVLDVLPGGINIRPTKTDFGPGAIEVTRRPLDVAIEGQGFFTVSDGAETRYTRDGRFSVNLEGELVLSSGAGRWRVLDDDGAPIRLDPDGGRVALSESGNVRQGEVDVAQIGVVDADQRQLMRKVGETLFDAGKANMEPRPVSLITGSLESSNFDVMSGLATMIEASRAYEMNAQLIRLSDQTIGVTVNTVGRLA